MISDPVDKPIPANAAMPRLSTDNPSRDSRTRLTGRPRKAPKAETTKTVGDTNVRLTVDFPAASAERLAELKNTLEAPSYVDVLRRALAFYEAVVMTRQNGGRVFIEAAETADRSIKISSPPP